RTKENPESQHEFVAKLSIRNELIKSDSVFLHQINNGNYKSDHVPAAYPISLMWRLHNVNLCGGIGTFHRTGLEFQLRPKQNCYLKKALIHHISCIYLSSNSRWFDDSKFGPDIWCI
ncbi:hypothetical protein MUK42_34290, partial [Musa troglodytarum]